MEPLILRAELDNWNKDISFLFRQGDHVAGPLIMEKYDDGDYCPPTAIIKLENAQALIDDLWNAGLRPSEGTGSAGSLRATEKHLSEMRAIASKFLEVELK